MKRWLIGILVSLWIALIIGCLWSYTSFLRIPENQWGFYGFEVAFQEECWQAVHSGFEIEQVDHTLQFFNDGHIFEDHILWDVSEDMKRWSMLDIHGRYWTMRYSEPDHRWYKKVRSIYCMNLYR